METNDELRAFLADVTVDGYRGRLLARGDARALIRQDGVLPEDSPRFASDLDLDLAEYGLSLLRASLALRECGGEKSVWATGFVTAGRSFEVLVKNGSPEDVSRGFYQVIGAACYHLAGYSAQAFSLLSQAHTEQNISPAEKALTFLIMRDFQALKKISKNWLIDDANSDARIVHAARNNEIDLDDIVYISGTTAMFRALAYFDFALQTGEATLVEFAKHQLQCATALSKHANAVSLWWLFRISLNLIDDLWSSSLHQLLPSNGPQGSENYDLLRRMFISALYSRRAAEVELWPSQIEAAKRAVDIRDDLVVALPTSAGKTRIAEIAALMTLSNGLRVLIVTPLRALSAQMERSFRRMFSPLGFSVSSLYGASGVAGNDEDTLKSRNIVIATPEKLDFALRNDSTIIDDIGLIVFDEGHLIGPTEREIRYENLVQKLLRREDAHRRRMVCLSAILPEGEHLNDLTAWIRSDDEGDPIQLSWRPTRQRFGTLYRQGNSARLDFNLETDGPFISRFIQFERAFPSSNRDLTLAAAWKFAGQGKRTLIFCTERRRVEEFAKAIVSQNRDRVLSGLLEDGAISLIQRAVVIGQEWLGKNHPVVQCLQLGVAVHHARLPSPFLRELESLLGTGVLKVIVASPTLAQGLNLNAAVLLVPYLHRNRKLISGEEFANVAGRAGRAFVDLEGLVVHVMYDHNAEKFRQWQKIVTSAKARSLSSGIISVIDEVAGRLSNTRIFERQDAFEYLSNSLEAWFPQSTAESDYAMEGLIERLDAIVLGLIETLDANSEDLPRLLDEALAGSLWLRQISKPAQIGKIAYQKWILLVRSRLIWNKATVSQRRGLHAMGVGLESGLKIDHFSRELIGFLYAADAAALSGDIQELQENLVSLARIMFDIRPFIPNHLPPNWESLLRFWISGDDIEAIDINNMRIIEDAFVYRLVWGMEVIRMYCRVNGITSELAEGIASACLETGLPKHVMATLVRSGLPSRIMAKNIVQQLNPIINYTC